MESFLDMKIEELRLELVGQAVIYGSLTHEKVVSISQQLDRYIMFYQRLLKRNRIKNNRLDNKQFLMVFI
ncbi:Spo0E family sporulation regulatory protein-aspartic acid phosphatase [Paenibacillus sp. LMG 31458]|uniref:Spo0E family sporulation regulatory protein-aspartic acid phosphatase n=1 Tax=Paenibacillus phytorum TaxID=2654977 RepID=A0ABX1XWP5_9BACL|nr:Spo0E family sporulation regulatory protein-aspartic acid phosphatase [Paenibacillus phytorum]